MKIEEKDISRFDQSQKDIDALFDDLVYMDADEENDEGFIQSHPGAAAIAAAALVGMPAAGIGIAGIGGQAAEIGTDGNVNANFVDPGHTQNGDNDTVESVEEISKTIHFNVDGPGHIEAASNCTIGDNNSVNFDDADSNAQIKFVRDVDGASIDVTMNGLGIILDEGDTLTLEAHSDYSDFNVKVVDVVAEQKAAEEAAAAQKAAEEAAAAQAQARAAEQRNYGSVQKTVKASNSAPARQAAAYNAAPVQQAAQSVSAPSSGAAQNAMTGDELAEAHEIFNSYNSWRASRGLSPLSWSDDCANMAYGSATGCAARGQLVHRLGIPSGVQNTYSDILQYSTWRMSGSDAVNRWANSTGHRKQMQCDSATQAAVAAFNNNGTWYYAVVYNFSGCNQSGS